MPSRRFHLRGLFATLLALMVQLGVGAAVPRIDPIAVAGVLCHAADEDGGVPAKAPSHPADCLVCPLCGVVHAPFATLPPVNPGPKPPDVGVVLKAELPPPSTAPPTRYWPPSQPRAPPDFS